MTTMTDDERKNMILDAAKESQEIAEKFLEPIKDAALAHQKMIEDIMRPNKMMEEFMRPQKLMEEFGRPPEDYLKALMPLSDPLYRQIDPAIFVNPNAASEFQKRLMKWIAEFESNLDQEHEVGVRLVSFGQAVTFHLENIGYWDPSLISFSGFAENGDPVKLIQHVSQISILLVKMKREDPTKPKKPIGFFGDSPKDPDPWE